VLTVVVVLVAAQARNLLWAAWGVTAGAVLEATADLAGVAFLLRVRLRLRWPTPRALRDMASLVGASLSGPGIWTAAETIERGFASFLPAGSIAALSYARRIVATLTHLAFRGFVISTIQMQLSTIKAQLRAHARLVVLAAIPIAIILLALSGPLVAIVFERLGFTSLEVQVLAGALRPYALAVVGIALSRIPFGMAYAQKQAQAILSYFLVLSVALVLVDAVALYLGVGVPSFGLGYSIAQWCGLVWLVFSVLPRGQRAFLTRTDAIQLMLVGLSGWVGSWALAALIQRRTAGSRWADWFVLAAGAVGCGTGLLISAWALRLEEARQLVRLAGEEWR
jgi:putative peptidoglycan lipid II flippase